MYPLVPDPLGVCNPIPLYIALLHQPKKNSTPVKIYRIIQRQAGKKTIQSLREGIKLIASKRISTNSVNFFQNRRHLFPMIEIYAIVKNNMRYRDWKRSKIKEWNLGLPAVRMLLVCPSSLLLDLMEEKRIVRNGAPNPGKTRGLSRCGTEIEPVRFDSSLIPDQGLKFK